MGVGVTALAAGAVILSSIGTTLPSPVTPGSQPVAPHAELTAEAWILYDATADVVLEERNANVERPMASVTKVMTALVVRDKAAVEEIVTVSQNAADTRESEVGIRAGERWSVGELLAGVLVRSGNDAAVALAEHVGGSVEGFADLMNVKAAELSLEHSHFMNPHGLDQEGHYTSATDLLTMTRAALADPVLTRLARTRVVKFRDTPGRVSLRINNTNRLLGAYPGVVGFKTGFTGLAGRVLISVADVGPRRLIAVVMGSEDHFADTRDLLDYGFATFGAGDRMRHGLLEEEGGGGAVPLNLLPLLSEDQRLRALGPLADGTWAVTPSRETSLGEAIERLLRAQLSVLLGGSE